MVSPHAHERREGQSSDGCEVSVGHRHTWPDIHGWTARHLLHAVDGEPSRTDANCERRRGATMVSVVRMSFGHN
jgi:hypothetical protein